MKSKMNSPARLAKTLLLALLLAVLGFATTRKAAAGSINAMTTPLPSGFNPGRMLLLPDARIMVQISGTNGNIWKFLYPDSQGHYLDGQWSNCPPMHIPRGYFSSSVLTDGRVFVAGGEYNPNGFFGLPDGATAEIFDPQANNGAGSWTFINPPASLLDPSVGNGFFDSESVLLPNGNVLVAPVYPHTSGGTLIYNPFTDGWSAGGNTGGIQDEASWVKLPDDSILTIDRNYVSGANYFPGTNSERYIPASNTWIPDRPVPVELYSTNNEIGAALLLTNGTVLYIGGNNTNTSAVYTPSPLGGTNWGSWTIGPHLPNGLVMRDAPACVLNNGKVLLALVPPVNDSPVYLYEYNPDTGVFTLVFTDSSGINSDPTSMLQLPDGNVLFQDTLTVYVYQPDPSPLPVGKPTIQSVSYNSPFSLHLTGTLFNGISQGGMYGDDGQMDSNYPLVRFTFGSSVYYGRSHNWSSTSVMTGSKVVTTEVEIPVAVLGAPGTYSLQVVANGNASDSVSFTQPALTWVDFNYSGTQNGSFPNPFVTLAQGTNSVPSGGTIAIKGPSINANQGPAISHETMKISKPMKIITVGGVATIGH